MPHALELPGVRGAVVPQMRPDLALVDEFVALAFGHAAGGGLRTAAGGGPRLAAIVGALDDLPEPRARLRGEDAIRLNGRPLEVIDLPAREVRACDLPRLARAVRCQDERALLRPDQKSDLAHGSIVTRSAPGFKRPMGCWAASGVVSSVAPLRCQSDALT